jgi:hypothetical protein
MYGLIPQLQPVIEPFSLIFPPHGLFVILLGTVISMIPLPAPLSEIDEVKNSIRFDTVRWVSGILLFMFSLTAIFASGSSSFLYFRF